MKKNKIHIWTYDSLYPIQLHVTCTEDLKGLFEKYTCINKNEIIDTNWGVNVAFVEHGIYDKTTGRNVMLVVFRTIKDMTFGTIVHEANHVAQRIWEVIGEQEFGIEADSYLTEWVASSINNCRLEIEKLNKKSKKK